MGKFKKAYVDSGFRTRDSNSDSDFKFESKEPLDLPVNIVCYVGGISIPRTWRTIESHSNRFYTYLKREYPDGFGVAYTWDLFFHFYLRAITQDQTWHLVSEIC